MKKQEFVNQKDNSKGVNYKLEAGDVLTVRFSSPKVLTAGQFPAYSIGVTTPDGEDVYVRLTKAQHDALLKLGDLTGKKIEAYEYENKYSKQKGTKYVGVRLAQ